MITNRANDTLKILSIDDFSNPEFTTDFDIDTMILGAADYKFNVYYTPTDESPDSLILTINTNGGTKTAKIYRRSVLSPICDCIQAETVLIYPNPASDYLYIYSNMVSKKEYLVSDINGKIVKRHLISNNDNIHKIEIDDLKPGFYFIKSIAGIDKSGTYKFIKN
jgi:hypothetical protein